MPSVTSMSTPSTVVDATITSISPNSDAIASRRPRRRPSASATSMRVTSGTVEPGRSATDTMLTCAKSRPSIARFNTSAIEPERRQVSSVNGSPPGTLARRAAHPAAGRDRAEHHHHLRPVVSDHGVDRPGAERTAQIVRAAASATRCGSTVVKPSARNATGAANRRSTNGVEVGQRPAGPGRRRSGSAEPMPRADPLARRPATPLPAPARGTSRRPSDRSR